ncbi:hypothetical protein HII31_07392 [Pseudocercospora fuligena]|uniref:Uncharacterized protein n=1 Tax=Pseudocercospora fuligena TaxID=685502 RepID=A0A8H6VKG9_9PEZI|nr:hypothetical protein HII31_07392 [Pseudocercospora fuligena]
MLKSGLLLGAASILVHVAAQSRVEDIDIPQQCRSTCQPLLDQSRNCDDQYSQDGNNDGLDQGYVNCICSAQNAANYIPQCNSCIQQDPNYLNSDNNNAFNNNGYNEVQQWMQTCNFQNGGINGGNIYPTPTYNGNGNGGDGYGLVYITTYDQYGNPQVVQTPVPTGVNGAGGYYPGDSGYVTSYDQYGDPQVVQTQGGDGNYYPGNVIGGNYGNPVSVSYTTTTQTDQYGNSQTYYERQEGDVVGNDLHVKDDIVISMVAWSSGA